MVFLGGPLATFGFVGAGLWAAAYYAGTGSFEEPAWLMFCVACLFGLVMNFNPFIRMDASSVLMDWTGIPNLRAHSFKYLERRLVGLFVKESDKEKKGSEPKERITLLLYGLIAGMMTVLFFIVPIVSYGRLLVEGSPHKGRIVMEAVVLTIALRV
jgi:hypothetical protein